MSKVGSHRAGRCGNQLEHQVFHACLNSDILGCHRRSVILVKCCTPARGNSTVAALHDGQNEQNTEQPSDQLEVQPDTVRNHAAEYNHLPELCLPRSGNRTRPGLAVQLETIHGSRYLIDHEGTVQSCRGIFTHELPAPWISLNRLVDDSLSKMISHFYPQRKHKSHTRA